MEIILGAHNIKQNEFSQIHIRGENIIVHEQYNVTSYQNDIALIKLAHPVTLNNAIKTVNLPLQSDSKNQFVNSIVTSIGWGLTHDVPYPSINDISSVLMAVNLAVIPLVQCYDYNDNDYNIIYVTQNNICTSGYRAKGSCEGDSGSPLMFQGRQIGLVSIGPTECEACYPSVYTHVGKYLDWIVRHSDVVIAE